MKVVINTHRVLKFALVNLLISLDYQKHVRDIIVSVADVPKPHAHQVIQNYKQYFQLHHIITYPTNIDEYTSFVSLASALHYGAFPNDDRFIILHDTMEAGRRFWKLLKFYDSMNMTSFMTNMYHLNYKLRYVFPNNEVYVQDMFTYKSPYLVTSTQLYLGTNMQLTNDSHKAFRFYDIRDINTTLSKITYDYIPFCNNFNLGIVTRSFLLNAIFPIFDNLQFNKTFGIDIEINQNHPYNLKNLAKYWRYADVTKAQVFGTWKNEYDVFGNGNQRAVVYIPILDLKKFLYFYDGRHDIRN